MTKNNKIAALVPDKPEIGRTRAVCPVIGVGASAGGLEAYQEFVAAAKTGMGLCYVLVQHLDPDHDSMLDELLGRRTKLTVSQIENGMIIKPDHIYLIPPGSGLFIEDAELRLEKFIEPRGQRRPIDDFFESLAEDQMDNAACIILSGTGADGTDGLRAVKEAGGLTIAQDPTQAKYDGMPSSAVATGLVDLVMPAGDMPEILHNYFIASDGKADSDEAEDAGFLRKVVEAVRYRTGHDFNHYKPSTISRRIARRMHVIDESDRTAYVKRLLTNSEEAQLLFRDLLINVTSFFRDPESFNTLRREVIPEFVKGKGAGDAVRVWVPGCSSGEEAYSLAMLLAEEVDRVDAPPSVTIFATDIDPTMLSMAREGLYPLASVKDIPPELRERYFIGEEKGFRVGPRIRDMVRVSNHSIIKDPPFSKLDLISCRNMLIYFDADLQKKIMPIFHYSLRKNGYLFLGPSENLAGHSELMDAVDRTHRIYRRADVPARPLSLPLNSRLSAEHRKPNPAAAFAPTGTQDFDEDAIQRKMMDRYAPPFVLLNSDQEVIYSSNRTGRYLEMSAGKPTARILDLAKDGLRSAIRAVLSEDKDRDKKSVVIKRGIKIEVDDKIYTVDISADPLTDGSLLLVFQEASDAALHDNLEGSIEVTQFTDEIRIRSLEDELSETRQNLRSTVSELETSNEELKSSNEEMMSMNEELQSANEELSTINDELKNKIDQLADANSDINNFFESTRIATIFLDDHFRIRNFTPEAARVFKFSRKDKDRQIDEVRSGFDSDLILEKSKQVLETLKGEELRVKLSGRPEQYLVRILPYRTVANEIRGVVITFTDVSEMIETTKQLEISRKDANQRLKEIERVYRTTPIAMGLFDTEKRYLRMNQNLADMVGYSIKYCLGKSTKQIVPDFAELTDPLIQAVIDTGEAQTHVEMEGKTNATGDEVRTYVTDWYPYKTNGKVTAVGVLARDVTVEQFQEMELRRVMHELQHRVKNMLANVMALVRQAGRSKKDSGEIVERLSSRISALAKTHNLLTETDWRSATFKEVLIPELIDVYGEDRISLKGPDLELNPKAILSLSMTVHELATNAAKYGALSNDVGVLNLHWSMEDRGDGEEVVVTWEEINGPEVVQPPSDGYGSTLIEASIKHGLGGTFVREFKSSGVLYKFRIPKERAVVKKDAQLENLADPFIRG